ncbi:MAG TPA: hypothetical protein PKD92_02605 [Novosphingobium sp.]|nr:hypothetical protein [Novosphingobium sp.]HMP55442.1 hypothetical protein [Novosphingobium sp.]
MNSDRFTRIGLALGLAGLPLLAGCTGDLASTGKPASAFGEANRQTMMAQVVNPEPEYESLVPPTSALKAAQAADRYATGAVKQPERTSTTEGSD